MLLKHPVSQALRLLCLFALLSTSAAICEAADESVLITPGSRFEAQIRSSEIRRFQIDLRSGEFLELTVEQEGVDLEVVFKGEKGNLLLAVDSPNGLRGTERLYWLAEQKMRYEIMLVANNGAGRYVMHNLVKRTPNREDRMRAEASLSHAQGDRIRIAGPRDKFRRAVDYYRHAGEIWRELGLQESVAVTWIRIGELWGKIGDPKEKIRSYEKALETLTDDFPTYRIYALLDLGGAYQENLRPEAALEAFQEALSLAQEIGDRFEEATALNNQAMIYDQTGRMKTAIEMFYEAYRFYDAVGARYRAALVLNNIGSSRILTGRLDEAEETLQKALEIHRSLNADRGRIIALTHLGWINHLREDYEEALHFYDRARKLSRQTNNLQQLAGVLDRTATAFLELGRSEEAEAVYQKALRLLEEQGDSLDIAQLQANLGQLYLKEGNLKDAERMANSALESLNSGKIDNHALAHALYLKSRIVRRRGKLAEALIDIEKTLELIESQRMGSSDSKVRIAFVNTRFAYYEYLIDLLMELDQAHPNQGHSAAALNVVERSRARSLVEDLTTAEVLTIKPVAPLDLSKIQSEFLDPDTVLLAYALGEKRSFVWTVTQDSVETQTLPASEKIEQTAKDLHQALGSSRSSLSAMQTELLSSSLSEQIIPESIRRSTNRRRVVVMADGALQSIPFSILLDPEIEVVPIPSTSSIYALRNRSREPGTGIAVLADPPFNRNDPRIPDSGPSPDSPLRRPDVRRLNYSRQEAEAVRELVPGSMRRRFALGLDASRELAISRELSTYRILHFATHGIFNTEHPERSGLIFSMFDSQHQPIDGVLLEGEIYNLNLSADLVVLSACQTALGRNFRGEGVVGLARAFLYAGASRVVVSLWEVDDEATAELMKRFYQGLFREGLSPSAALHRAQLSVRSEERWESPFFWAGFVLLGDWR